MACQFEALQSFSLCAEKAVAGEVVFAEVADRLAGSPEAIQSEPSPSRDDGCAVSTFSSVRHGFDCSLRAVRAFARMSDPCRFAS
jgi:hypothetical protein